MNQLFSATIPVIRLDFNAQKPIESTHLLQSHANGGKALSFKITYQMLVCKFQNIKDLTDNESC